MTTGTAITNDVTELTPKLIEILHRALRGASDDIHSYETAEGDDYLDIGGGADDEAGKSFQRQTELAN